MNTPHTNHPDDERSPLGETYRQGPVLLRGQMIPEESTTERLLKTDESIDWLHRDPWRVLRIQAEFVDGFGSLAELGPAVSIFGSARADRHHRRRAGHHGGGEQGSLDRRRQIRWPRH